MFPKNQTSFFTHWLLDHSRSFQLRDSNLSPIKWGNVIEPMFLTQCEDQLYRVYEHCEGQHRGFVILISIAGLSFENIFETHSGHALEMSKRETHAMTMILGGVLWEGTQTRESALIETFSRLL